MRKITHATRRQADGGAARPGAVIPSADGSLTFRPFGGVSMRSRKALVALFALIATLVAATTPAVSFDTGVAAADQSSVDSDSDSDIAFINAFRLGASTNGATWS